MILEKLLLIELDAQNNNDLKKIEAVKTIKNLINQIDFRVETLPMEDNERLAKVLYSLKGEQLSKYEMKLVKEIVEK